MRIGILVLVVALGCVHPLPLQASSESPGRIVAVDAGHLYFENGDVYAVAYSPTFSLTYVGNVYRTLGISAVGAAGAPAGAASGLAPTTRAGVSSSPSSVVQRCAAITRRGTQCSRNAQPGSIYCWQHQK